MVDTNVLVAIEPRRLNLTGVPTPADGNWRPATDAALNALFGRGYRAGLSQSPPLIGASYVAIEHVDAAGPAALSRGGDEPTLPSRPGGGAITDKISALVDKLNAVPIEAIGENIRQATAHLNTLLGSPQVADSIKHLDSTLAQIDQMMTEVRPRIGPLMQGAPQDSGLPDAIRELTEAARSIRSLTDYLGRHPEAILLGKSRQGS
jgi:paraquat-inducible protein B